MLMKRHYLLLAFLFLTQYVFNQITTEPQFPIDSDEVLITFDATGTALENYTGDLYTHTGVILEGSNSWQYVIGNWGNNQTQPKLTRISDKQYTLNISPSIRSFYNVPDNKIIRKMAFVFRSANANIQTVPDLFVDVYESGLSINITSPDKERIMVKENEIIPVNAISPQADSIFLFVNNELRLAVEGIEIEYNLLAENFMGYWNDVDVNILAKKNEESANKSFYYFVIPLPDTATIPSGIEDGINYIDDNTVILSLYAPYKGYVFVLGDFNNWEYDKDFYMKKTPDHNRYWIQINDLEADKEYIFQYEVDGEIRIGDPFAEKVSDPWDDKYISNSTYPDLILYPTGMTTGIATVLQTAQQPYSWQINDFTPPAVEDMVVYELLIRDFTALHSYQSLSDTINYFKRLGVNVIELMPVSEFEGNISWGYNPNYYFAPDKYYGPKNTLKTFIDLCHANGIAVVLDIVLNHSFGTSPYVMLYWDKVNKRPSANSPFYNPIAKHDFNVGYDFNHESQATKTFTKRVVNFWITEYKIDGFRFDLSKGFTQKNTLGNTAAWGQYDQSRINIWDEYSTYIWQIKPDAYVILEHFAENSEETVLANMGMLIWGNLNYNYNEATMGYHNNNKSDFSWISYKKRGWNKPHVIGYMESHDEERLLYKNYMYGNSEAGYNIKDTTTALQRMELAANFFFTIPGPKMIWQFGEYGYDVTIEQNGRTGQKPIRWQYLNDWRRKYLFNVYAALIDLKKNHDVFKTDDFTLQVTDANKSIILRHNTMDVVIVGNFETSASTITPGWTSLGKWYEFYSQSEIEIDNDNSTINLAAGEYRLFSTQKIEKPEWLNTYIDEQNVNPDKVFLVYPNPSNGEFHFSLNPDEQQRINLQIYTITGELVDEITHEISPTNPHLDWKPNKKLMPGIYFAKIRSYEFNQTIKLLVK